MRTTPENDELVADPATPAPPRRGVGAAVLGRLVIVLAVLGLAGGGIWLVTKASAPVASPTTMEIPALQVKAADVKPGSVAPVNATLAGGATQQTAPQQAQPKPGKDPLTGWTERASQATGIPARALFAYGNAELAMRQMQPNCKISWATLAGIGRIESNHGQYGGAVLGQDGRPSKPIIGVPLDGSPGVKAIGDTDRGQFDGDAAVDRAVGPMQFIPSTWRRYAADGNRDGVGDPQQIDDATLAAARYLCVNNRDMSAASGWWQGILSYNNSTEYAQKVFGLADDYAKAVAAGRS
ncbi:murein transglycosylase [Amycolatopsis sp. WAC 01375]|uniref:lytic transglycosylase domain-containing protein n=1 Tax=unclassified Amycolatopsis TaxID=2618356 RepID=UPI000F7897A7|nr:MULTISPECIES: lytic murein transglycosylase [unclassified Amycolatopsis]RSM78463.1 murein transglycosylase [Amycolatopsis sp. WAC 01375]RSN30926.1 murein transglycosylase [Amycolatopsis sp. WAC 01416]